jgi:hypothetical protein
VKQVNAPPKPTKLVRSQFEITAERGKLALKSLVKRRQLVSRMYAAVATPRIETALDWNDRMRRKYGNLKPLSSLGRV